MAERPTPRTPNSELQNPFADSGAISSSVTSLHSGTSSLPDDTPASNRAPHPEDEIVSL